MYREENIEGKGIGCVATQNIEPGTLIFRKTRLPKSSFIFFNPPPLLKKSNIHISSQRGQDVFPNSVSTLHHWAKGF